MFGNTLLEPIEEETFSPQNEELSQLSPTLSTTSSSDSPPLIFREACKKYMVKLEGCWRKIFQTLLY